MSKQRNLVLIFGLLLVTASAGAGQIKTAKPGQPVERHLSGDQKPREWATTANASNDIKRVKVCRVETLCKMRFKDGATPRTRVKNMVLPLLLSSSPGNDAETLPISEAFTSQVRRALQTLEGKPGLTIRFVGYTDDAPLTGRDESTYGNHLALSKAEAQRVALAMQATLGLPASAVESDGRGASSPIESNESVQGRTLNRRIEVEFWYDDPLQELPEEPQICPGDSLEVVTKVFEPNWGAIAPLELVNGQPSIPSGYAENLRRALTDIADRTNPRLRFVGYTKNEPLDRRTASVYDDDIGLSAARARRAMDLVMKDPQLSGVRAEHEGRGFVQSDDVVNTGFVEGQESFVRVQVVYDEPLPLDEYEGVDVERITQELRPKSPYELNVMRITVDGKPIDDPNRSSADIQRCTDVALDGANIQFRFDNLESRPRLNVAAHPVAIAVTELDGLSTASTVRFQMYTNYSSFIERAEIRIFEQGQSMEADPVAIVAVGDAGLAEWQPTTRALSVTTRELKYVLRAYDSKGHFDETGTRTLWLNQKQSEGEALVPEASSPELLAAYGESDLARHGIPLGSGTVKVQGGGVPAGHTVWVAGRQVPVDKHGNFAAEEILPTGMHTVEVGVLDAAGNGSLFLRDLEFKRTDLFYVGVVDLTVSENRARGPINLLQGANARQPYDSSLNGRVAFYMNGEVRKSWKLTASADTREGPVKDLFSNFLQKTPESLFRRIDPDRYYPSFGDDGVVTEMAPTMGKFYVKAGRGESYGMWGNFNVGYTGNELAHVDRGLYGANLHYESRGATSFGSQRMAFEGFAAEPGTVPSYEEFRGTGGSLYFLRHQDILRGSDRVRIEMRDRDSGIVTKVVNLRYPMDYDIDYLQGRILLAEPLTSTASNNLLVRSAGLTGDEARLVVRYEYTPGFDSLDEVALGGQGHYWFKDHVRLGLTGNSNQGDAASSLKAADLTFRVSTDSWFKLQMGQSTGLLSSRQQSQDGGFGFQGQDDALFTDANARAYRADLSLELHDLFENRVGRLTFYKQSLAAGYSAPGQATIKATEQFGGTVRMPITNLLSLNAKGDRRMELGGLETQAIEADLGYKLAENWSASTGMRYDLRRDRSQIAPATQELGRRADAVAQLTYDSGGRWRAYGFVQGTVAASEGREQNNRLGVGGAYRLTQRFKIDGEVSDGDFGPGGRLGTSYLLSERTSLYLNYGLENERTDNGRRLRRGDLVSGAKTRLSSSSSVYLEERYQNGESMTGLTHATGVNLVAKERWNFGSSTEVGRLRDSQTGARTDRKAAGVRMGYGVEKLQASSAVEYRRDDAEQLDLTHTERAMWLFRNNFKFQLTPDWRVLGKLDHSISTSSLGDFFGGGYTEGVLGYAFRPVKSSWFNALAKYTYFVNVPTTDQVNVQNLSSEFIQRSHVAALDLTFDLTSKWSVGTKYAYRLGEVSLDRAVRNFVDNAAQLGVLRVDWRFRKNWESMVEGRMLELRDISQRRAGALASIYRYIGPKMKVGIGYNFTAFSDDLTDLSFDHRGAFFNLVVTQ